MSEINSEWRSSGSKEHIKEIKKTDLVLLSLLMCSNLMVQHCPCPLALGSAELYFQIDSEWAHDLSVCESLWN